MNRRLVPLGLAAVLAAGCAADEVLGGAAGARSRGALEAVPDPPPADPGAASRAPAPPHDPYLDEAFVWARVNGQVLTTAQVRQEIGPQYNRLLEQRDLLEDEFRRQVRGLVLRRLVVDEGRRIGLEVTDQHLEEDERREERLAAARGDTIERYLQDIGISRTEWDEKRREKILWNESRLYFMGRYPDRAYNEERYRPSVESWVDPEEVRAWGRSHPEKVDRPATATLRILYLHAEDYPDAAAWRAAMAGLEERLAKGEPFADLAAAGRRFPGTGEGGLHPPVTRDSGDLGRRYLEWAFDPAQAVGAVSGRMEVGRAFVLLRLEAREEGTTLDIDAWGPRAFAELRGLRSELAWAEVQARLVEDGAVAPAARRSELIAEFRAEARRLRRELEPPDPGRTAAVPAR